MFNFEQNFDQEQEKEFALCSELQSLATELGIETPFAFGLNADMQVEQLKTIRAALEEIIENTDRATAERIRKMQRCPAGYKWDREGVGWRCQGGSHYESDAEFQRKYMK